VGWRRARRDTFLIMQFTLPYTNKKGEKGSVWVFTDLLKDKKEPKKYGIFLQCFKDYVSWLEKGKPIYTTIVYVTLPMRNFKMALDELVKIKKPIDFSKAKGKYGQYIAKKPKRTRWESLEL